MAKKQKDKPMLNLDGVEYAIEDMTDAQNHVNDIKNKLANNVFMRQQLIECEIVFVEKHQKGVKDLKEMLKEK